MSRKITIIIIAAAAAMITYGLICGQAQDVLTKASTICLECVGIG